MTLTLTETSTLNDIQRKFVEAYPYLRIKFYSQTLLLNSDTPLRAIDCTFTEVQLSRSTSIIELETLIGQLMNASIKVFRKTSNSWEPVTTKKYYSLHKHNWIGRNSANAIFDFELL
jgi:hypothetical protein